MTDRGYLLDLLDLLEGMQNVCSIKCPDYIAQLRERLAQPEEVPCKDHPDAPHGFDRNASHSEDRYVCECESWDEPSEYWEPPPTREWAGLMDQDFADMVVITLDSNGSKFDSRMFARYIEAVLRKKNT
jgi:hypothetical protein